MQWVQEEHKMNCQSNVSFMRSWYNEALSWRDAGHSRTGQPKLRKSPHVTTNHRKSKPKRKPMAPPHITKQEARLSVKDPRTRRCLPLSVEILAYCCTQRRFLSTTPFLRESLSILSFKLFISVNFANYLSVPIRGDRVDFRRDLWHQ